MFFDKMSAVAGIFYMGHKVIMLTVAKSVQKIRIIDMISLSIRDFRLSTVIMYNKFFIKF